MAENEKKATAKSEPDTQASTAAVQAATDEGKKIEREPYIGKDKKEYWAYVVRGEVRGRPVKADFVAKDQGGYEVLDIIFDVKDTAELIMREEEMTDDTGKVTRYTVYEVQNVDSDGVVYSYKVKPARDSDKALLNMILNVRAQKVKAAENASREKTKASI